MPAYPRDLRGYGAHPPQVQWPGHARIAVQFVLNYEEGGENCTLHGDAASEAFLSEIIGAQPWPGQRHANMESIYEFGARAGFWRIHRLFTERKLPLTVFGVATALARSPEQLDAMQDAGWDIASHGLKWVEHKDMTQAQERAAIDAACRLHKAVTGTAPRGWYTGRCSAHTLRLIAERGDIDYISDSYADDLPYWVRVGDRDQLVVPYTLDANDMRFATAQGFNAGDQFEAYLRDSFDTLYDEGFRGHPKMLSIGLHCRLIGRPGRIAALRRFLDYIEGFDGVWIARRGDIAAHWANHHPPQRAGLVASELTQADFVARFGSIFEHSSWIAQTAWDDGIGPANDTATGLHAALRRVFRMADDRARLGVLTAHPDLAGKLAAAGRLTAESTAEQAGAGLDALTDDERARFTDLNARYVARFGFPFIIAVRDHDKASILSAFQTRLTHDRDQEFAEACHQVERIARHRLMDLLPS